MTPRSVELVRGDGGAHAVSVAAEFGEGLWLRRRNSPPLNLLGSLDRRTVATNFGGTAPGTPWATLATMTPAQLPYRHAVGGSILPVPRANELLSWLEDQAKWKQNRGSFYEADETLLAAGGAWDDHFGPRGVPALERQASSLFGVELCLHGPIAAHRMTAGQGVGIHTDEPGPEDETHRLVLFLSRPRTPTAGGHFVLSANDAADSGLRILTHTHNAAIAFPLTSAARHAVTLVRSGTRYSIIVSFRAVASPMPPG